MESVFTCIGLRSTALRGASRGRGRAAIASWLWIPVVALLYLGGSPACCQEGAERFPDLPTWHWAWRYVEAVCDADIVQGYTDGLYHPDWFVTRDQMAAYVSRALAGGDEGVPSYTGTPSFSDVSDEHWALDYIEYAVASEVVQGYADDTYHPDENVNRAQMAVYIARALVAPSGEAALADYVPADPRNFPDVPPTGYGDDGTEPYWAYMHVEYCVEHGVVQGYDDGYYYPERQVTRDQMAVYVARAFELPIPPEPYNITDHFPLGEGDTWTYEAVTSEGSFTFTDTVSGTVVIDGDVWSRIVRDSGRVLYARAAPEGLYVKGVDEPEVGEIRWMIPQGESLFRIQNGLIGGIWIEAHIKTTLNGEEWGYTDFTWDWDYALEDANVAAGIFENCMKAYVTLQLPGDPEPREDGYVWYARGVGEVKREMVGYSHQLLSATVGGVSYP